MNKIPLEPGSLIRINVREINKNAKSEFYRTWGTEDIVYGIYSRPRDFSTSQILINANNHIISAFLKDTEFTPLTSSIFFSENIEKLISVDTVDESNFKLGEPDVIFPKLIRPNQEDLQELSAELVFDTIGKEKIIELLTRCLMALEAAEERIPKRKTNDINRNSNTESFEQLVETVTSKYEYIVSSDPIQPAEEFIARSPEIASFDELYSQKPRITTKEPTYGFPT